MKMKIAAASAPTSGRARRREIRDRGSRFGASGLAGAAEGSVTTDELMDCSWEWWGRGSRAAPGPPTRGLSGVVLRVGDDLVDVALVDDRGTGQDRASATDVVAVGQVQPQRRDGHVPLHVGLLVDGERYATALDLLGDVLAQVERGDLGLAAGVGRGLLRRQGDVTGQRDDVGDRRVLLQLGPDGLLHRRQVRAVDIDVSRCWGRPSSRRGTGPRAGPVPAAG